MWHQSGAAFGLGLRTILTIFSSGDSEASETLDKCLECMHAEEICVIPYNSETFEQEFGVASERDLKCEVEHLYFSKVFQVTVQVRGKSTSTQAHVCFLHQHVFNGARNCVIVSSAHFCYCYALP